MNVGSWTLLTKATRGKGSDGPHCACTFADTAIPRRITRTRRRFITHLQSFRKAASYQPLRRQLALQRSAVEELKGAQAEGARGENVFQQIVNEHRLLRKRADHFQRAMEELWIRLRAFEAMREDEAVVPAKERRVLSRDHFRVHFVRVGEKG